MADRKGGRLRFRAAREDEKEYLQSRLAETGHEQVALDHCWVAERAGADGGPGQLLGMLPGRLVWQLEPLYLFPEVTNRMTRSRAALGMYLAAEAWIREQPVHWFFAITRSAAVKRWSGKLGWWRIYRGAATFVKHL